MLIVGTYYIAASKAKVDSRERLARDALDSLALGALVVLADGHIAHANLAADKVLERGDGLIVKNRRLTCVHGLSCRRFEAAVAAATSLSNPFASAVAIRRRESVLAYLAAVSPLAGGVGGARALIVFRDPDAVEISLEPCLRSLFSLTSIEAAIAVDVSKGLPAPQIALKRGVKPSTIKTQLASVATKMGCARQAEIAARVAGLPPLFAEEKSS